MSYMRVCWLAYVLRYEQPALAEQRERLVLQMSENKQELKKLEDMLLHELANATGNILDNEGASLTHPVHPSSPYTGNMPDNEGAPLDLPAGPQHTDPCTWYKMAETLQVETLNQPALRWSLSY